MNWVLCDTAYGEIIASKAQVVYEGKTVQIDLSQQLIDHYFQYGSSPECGQMCGPYLQTFSFMT